jgi:hypothetical protein
MSEAIEANGEAMFRVLPERSSRWPSRPRFPERPAARPRQSKRSRIVHTKKEFHERLSLPDEKLVYHRGRFAITEHIACLLRKAARLRRLLT